MIRIVRCAAAIAAIFLPSLAPAQSIVPQARDSYFLAAQAELRAKIGLKPNNRKARNVILFVGDGMGISTLTAARIYAGQKKGLDGESNRLTIDKLPYGALVKTYTHDAQVADSAPTATAMVSGVKTRNDIIGLDQSAQLNDCAGSRGKEVSTLFEQAERLGLSTGIVSTAAITHATPAAAYAHVPSRDWENDSELPGPAKENGCKDIARQLVEWAHGDGFEVVLGGGRAHFLPSTATDVEEAKEKGFRSDGRNLIEEWRRRNRGGTYVWNKAAFDRFMPSRSTRLLGLFERTHMEFEADRAWDAGGEPSLAEMTRKAVSILLQRRKGFVLMVEGGRIDHAHHGGNAARALEDMLALDEAVRTAMDMVDLDDTLIVVAADHSHTLTISGYPRRGNPILGTVIGVDGQPALARDKKSYTTLGYANGPGASTGERQDPRSANTKDLDYRQPALVPTGSATHSGEDVAVRAIGPSAHLFQGTVEQNLIYHIMAHALRYPQ